MPRTPEDLITFTQTALECLRTDVPLVQCITNSVVTGFTANAMLALGASPAMADVPGEAGAFAGIASGVLINLGTPHAEQREAMTEAVDAANAAGTPWVLDPVAIGAMPVRTPLSYRLRDLQPTVVRGNASEIIALSGSGTGGRGVDTVHDVESALPTAQTLAAQTGGVVAVSGPVDLVTDGTSTVRIANGSPLLTKVTGGGCALGAAMAAFASVDDDRLATTVAAVTVYTIAAELAADGCAGPGSFAVRFIDALGTVDGDAIKRRAAIS